MGSFESISIFDCHEDVKKSTKTVKFIIAILVSLDNCDLIQQNVKLLLQTDKKMQKLH